MKLSAPSLTEKERVTAVATYLRALPANESVLSGLVQLATSVLGMPTAVIGLSDETHTQFVFGCGLSDTMMPRQLAFCDYVISSGEHLLVTDAMHDPRFALHPLVTGNTGIRFYAGVPLTTSRGVVLGTFCVSDTRPHHLSDDQRRFMSTLGSVVVERLEAEVSLQALVADNERLERLSAEYERLFDAMTEAVIVHDHEGSAVSANRSARRLLGVRSLGPRALGERLGELSIFAESGARLARELLPPMVAIRTGKDVQGTILKIEQKGIERWFLVSSALNRRASGEVASVLTTLADVTTLKRQQR